MRLNSLESLFEDQIRDLYSAENQLTKALPRIAKRASSHELKSAIERHLEETRGHVERLQSLGDELDIRLGGKKCKAMVGLLEEGKEAMEADGADPVIDAAIIAAAQRVEHYEISAYGTARTMARQLGHSKAADLLQATLDEEAAADKKLTMIAESGVLDAAAHAADGGEAQI